MSTQAAGAYLQELRNAGGLSREAVARQLRTSDSQVERIELGQTNTRGSVWFEFARIVGANLYHLAALLTDERATRDDGVALAHEALQSSMLTDEERRYLESLSPEARRAVLELARRMRQ